MRHSPGHTAGQKTRAPDYDKGASVLINGRRARVMYESRERRGLWRVVMLDTYRTRWVMAKDIR